MDCWCFDTKIIEVPVASLAVAGGSPSTVSALVRNGAGAQLWLQIAIVLRPINNLLGAWPASGATWTITPLIPPTVQGQMLRGGSPAKALPDFSAASLPDAWEGATSAEVLQVNATNTGTFISPGTVVLRAKWAPLPGVRMPNQTLQNLYALCSVDGPSPAAWAAV